MVNEIIGRNPCKRVKGAGSRAKEILEHKSKARRLTTREVLAMLGASPPRYRAMLWLMAGCGLRLGEAMAVSRGQIDFKGETLRVDFQITEDGETESGKNSALQRRHIKARDEEEPGRVIPLPPNVAFELRRHIQNHGVWGPERLLFPHVTRTGFLYASYFYPKTWTIALDKGGVTYCKAHSLRHYYGSRLLYAGVPENDVADWMGHSSTDVLREHYHYIFEGAEQRGRGSHRNHADSRRGRPHRGGGGGGGARSRQDPHTTQPPASRRGLCCLCWSAAVLRPSAPQDFPSMTPANGLDGAATGGKPSALL
ncbi:site-specific integrase [Streptomyces sp. TRM49041]|uniref:tyrosine-type recombinase/integrase n=1 Tax=Streptomyces sp. TRM49041 TaxID=2603216 RepID=UPI0021CCC433|nr:site-specific integrase [Streptomyces sp. TRM49041]